MSTFFKILIITIIGIIALPSLLFAGWKIFSWHSDYQTVKAIDAIATRVESYYQIHGDYPTPRRFWQEFNPEKIPLSYYGGFREFTVTTGPLAGKPSIKQGRLELKRTTIGEHYEYNVTSCDTAERCSNSYSKDGTYVIYGKLGSTPVDPNAPERVLIMMPFHKAASYPSNLEFPLNLGSYNNVGHMRFNHTIKFDESYFSQKKKVSFAMTGKSYESISLIPTGKIGKTIVQYSATRCDDYQGTGCNTSAEKTLNVEIYASLYADAEITAK